jgi:hypothetical protein
MNTIEKIYNEFSHFDLTFAQIAEKYNMSLEDIELIFECYMNESAEYYGDDMDGDFDSAMASAGFGTDEDYGYYGEEY